jgi:hypothetical protein
LGLEKELKQAVTKVKQNPNSVPLLPKRGKDIKCFNDLPLDVQRTIDKMSRVGGAIDHTIKANRTAIAINYQHLYPDRYYLTGI